MGWLTLATQAYAISSLYVGKDGLDVRIGINTSILKPCIPLILKLISWLSSLVHELLMLMLASLVRGYIYRQSLFYLKALTGSL